MAAPIQVPAGFRGEFDFYCEQAGLAPQEVADLRNAVREDFEQVGRWVLEQAGVYRFMLATWGGRPSPDLCQGYLASKGLYYDDETLFQRLGIMLQVKMCARAAGALG